jgi:hypothetical protein
MTCRSTLFKRIASTLTALLVMLTAQTGVLSAQTAEPAVSPAFVTFITESYLNAKLSTAEEVGQLYGDRVGYYGSTLSRQAVVADKLRYYKRWPTRTFVLNQDSLKVTRTSVDATKANVRFEYTYSVSDGRETRKGRGVAQLQLTADDGRLVILNEDGKVVQRF